MKPFSGPVDVQRCPCCDAVLRLIGERASHLVLRCAAGHEFEWSLAQGYVELAHPARSEQVAAAGYHAEQLTRAMRSSSEDLHVSLRAALAGVHLAHNETHLALLLPEGAGRCWGVLVTLGGRVLEFQLGDAAEFTYQDRTTTWEQLAHRNAVEAVLQSLGDG